MLTTYRSDRKVWERKVRIGEVIVVAVVGSLLLIVDKTGMGGSKRSRAFMYGVVEVEEREKKHDLKCTRPFSLQD